MKPLIKWEVFLTDAAMSAALYAFSVGAPRNHLQRNLSTPEAEQEFKNVLKVSAINSRRLARRFVLKMKKSAL